MTRSSSRPSVSSARQTDWLAEAPRVVRPKGKLIVGFVDRESTMGRGYLARQSQSVVYREAVFYSAAEIAELLRSWQFDARVWGQTLFGPLE